MLYSDHKRHLSFGLRFEMWKLQRYEAQGAELTTERQSMASRKHRVFCLNTVKRSIGVEALVNNTNTELKYDPKRPVFGLRTEVT